MLGKLLKDEIKSYVFPAVVALLIGLVCTVFFKLLTLLPFSEEMQEYVVAMTGYALYYILMFMASAATVFSVVRFYKTMIGDCGYLTWTLPVKTSTVLWAKLIGALLLKLVFAVACIFCGFIFVIGNLNSVIYYSMNLNGEEVKNILSQFISIINAGTILFVALLIVLVALTKVYGLLSFYLCMAIGQLVGKYRIVVSVCCYFGITILNQIFAVLVIVFCVLSGVGANDWFFNGSMSGIHVFNWLLFIGCILIGIASVVYFLITHSIFKNRLNLE